MTKLGHAFSMTVLGILWTPVDQRTFSLGFDPFELHLIASVNPNGAMESATPNLAKRVREEPNVEFWSPDKRIRRSRNSLRGVVPQTESTTSRTTRSTKKSNTDPMEVIQSTPQQIRKPLELPLASPVASSVVVQTPASRTRRRLYQDELVSEQPHSQSPQSTTSDLQLAVSQINSEVPVDDFEQGDLPVVVPALPEVAAPTNVIQSADKIPRTESFDINELRRSDKNRMSRRIAVAVFILFCIVLLPWQESSQYTAQLPSLLDQQSFKTIQKSVFANHPSTLTQSLGEFHINMSTEYNQLQNAFDELSVLLTEFPHPQTEGTKTLSIPLPKTFLQDILTDMQKVDGGLHQLNHLLQTQLPDTIVFTNTTFSFDLDDQAVESTLKTLVTDAQTSSQPNAVQTGSVGSIPFAVTGSSSAVAILHELTDSIDKSGIANVDEAVDDGQTHWTLWAEDAANLMYTLLEEARDDQVRDRDEVSHDAGVLLVKSAAIQQPAIDYDALQSQTKRSFGVWLNQSKRTSLVSALHSTEAYVNTLSPRLRDYKAINVDPFATFGIDFAAAPRGGRVSRRLSTTCAYASDLLQGSATSISWVNKYSKSLPRSLGLSPCMGSASSVTKYGVLQPGECFAMQGQQGIVTVILHSAIDAKAVVLSHRIADGASHDSLSHASCAIREFSILGYTSEPSGIYDPTAQHLGDFVFDVNGEHDKEMLRSQHDEYGTYVSQLFPFLNPSSVKAVVIKFMSNHGNSHLTCLYHAQILGHLQL